MTGQRCLAWPHAERTVHGAIELDSIHDMQIYQTQQFTKKISQIIEFLLKTVRDQKQVPN
jgi:hypothetical protein